MVHVTVFVERGVTGCHRGIRFGPCVLGDVSLPGDLEDVIVVDPSASDELPASSTAAVAVAGICVAAEHNPVFCLGASDDECQSGTDQQAAQAGYEHTVPMLPHLLSYRIHSCSLSYDLVYDRLMTTNIVPELANKWWPLPPEKFFTMQRAADMWFGDELPPTLQAEMLSPLVTQSKAMLAFQILQQLAMGERQEMVKAQTRRYVQARSHIGKRTKTSRR
jgi:hypothetical protein